ncbi:hypothetical protein LJC58_10005 [Lachnospiraceae bacterium OttesenSCG-928-D06]|nr:hypothetical protein [Lachnospiraceae bacterium OttesenSCG-928-D06]
MKKNRIASCILLIFVVLSNITYWHIKLYVNDSNERDCCMHEIMDYIEYGIEEMLQQSEFENWEKKENELVGDDGSIVLTYDDDKIVKIVLRIGTKDEYKKWSVVGISLGMYTEEVLESFIDKGNIVTSHNLSRYITGVKLEKEGIKMIELIWDEVVAYVEVDIDTNNIDKLSGFNIDYTTDMKEFAYPDLDIKVNYPVFCSNNPKVQNLINNNIHDRIYDCVKSIEEIGVDKMTSLSIIDYEIKCFSSEVLSIVWKGEYFIENVKGEIYIVFNCNPSNGELLNLSEMGLSTEDIEYCINYVLDNYNFIKMTEYMEILENMNDTFYVTPLNIIVTYKNENNEIEQIKKIWR